MGKEKIYWTEKEDQLFLSYITTKSDRDYAAIRPTLIKVYSIVLRRYFFNFYELMDCEEQDLIDFCESSLVRNLDKFNNEKGKPFTFVGTCSRNYYNDYFRTLGRKKNNVEYVSIDDVDSDSFVESEEPDLLEMANKKLDTLLKKRLTVNQRTVVELIKEYINTKEQINQYDLSLFVQQRTGLSAGAMKTIGCELNINFFSKKMSVEKPMKEKPITFKSIKM